jgi:glucan phosphorylase
MSSLDFDLDSQMSHLETEWRQAYETTVAARTELQALAATPNPNASAIAKAQTRLERAEGTKAHVMSKIERLEDRMLGHS